MLQHTFCHINGIGAKTERLLWQSGIFSWADWKEHIGVKLSKQSRMEMPGILDKSLNAMQNDDPNFFCDRLATNEQWRIFPQFRSSTCYLDIETTGLGMDAEVTTIALYDGNEVSYYINGHNLEDFVEDIKRYTVLVSYNGKGFDVPFLENFFRIKLTQAHIDLRFVLARLGLKGGLKGCEKQLGINRGALDGVDGYFAVLLWQQYQRENDVKALETLLAYNIEDTVNLERLLVEAYNRNLQKTPFAEKLSLPYPVEPQLPFQPDLDCVDRLKRYYYHQG